MRSNISNRAVGFSIPLLVIFSTASMGALQENDVTPDVPESQIVVQANDESLPLVDDDHRDIERNIRLNQEDISKIRRDQINYELEKNILKEAYSSSFQTINTLITIGLAILAIFGFLGIRNVRDLQKRFSAEFSTLQELRSRYEKQLQDIELAQETAKTQMLEIAEINQAQNIRLQILEIQEKVALMIRNRGYERALEYLEVGIDLSPNDLLLLNQKAVCYWSLSDFPQAIVLLRRVIELDPEDAEAAQNLAEMYLLILDHKAYDELIEGFPAIIERRGSWLAFYFQAAREYVRGDLENLQEVVRANLAKDEPVAVPKDETWSFAQIQYALQGHADTPQKHLMLILVKYFMNQASPDEVLAAINQ